jgi:hypothetical protein
MTRRRRACFAHRVPRRTRGVVGAAQQHHGARVNFARQPPLARTSATRGIAARVAYGSKWRRQHQSAYSQHGIDAAKWRAAAEGRRRRN